jgi:hypothetical protein
MFNEAVSNSDYMALSDRITEYNELKSKMSWLSWRYYPATCKKGAYEIVINVQQYPWPARNSNQVPSEYKAVALTLPFCCCLTLSLLLSYIYGAPSKARYLTYIYIYIHTYIYIYIHIYGRDLLLGILLLEPCISLIYAWKTNKYTNYTFSWLIMYGIPDMLRHYIAIRRERS